MKKNQMKMKNEIKNKKENLINLLKQKNYRKSLIITGIILIFSTILFKTAAIYAESFDSPALGDILLDFLPVLNLNLLITFGYHLFILFFITLFITKYPKKLPMLMLIIGAFMIVRSILFSVTH